MTQRPPHLLPGSRPLAAVVLAAAFIASSATFAADNISPPTSGWRLLKTANPHGAEAVSMVHTADTARSDMDLAGMMLRCGDLHPEVAIVAVTLLPPHAQPNVTIRADGKEWRFESRIVPPGAELLLPDEATKLASGAWQSARELAVSVAAPDHTFGGVIPIEGLDAALATLVANCPAR